MARGKEDIGDKKPVIKKYCGVMRKADLEKLNRLDLWGIALHEEKDVCRETSLLATKVYAETYATQAGRDKYYGKDLIDDVVASIDDSGNIVAKDRKKISKIVEFAGLMYIE